MISGAQQAEETIRLPNFLLVGAAKCGTTSLYHYLDQHPDVFMSVIKEPRFLSSRRTNPGTGPGDAGIAARSIGSFEEYCRLFDDGAGRKAVGEASVDTFFHYRHTIPAIRKYLGDPRIIIILRNPVDRAYSAYNYHVRDGRETLPFSRALQMEKTRKQEGYAHLWQYVEGGMYAERIRAFSEHFSRVKVFLYDDLKDNAMSLVCSMYDFLEVDPAYFPDTDFRYNVSGIPRWNLANSLFTKPKRLHKVARTIGGVLLGGHRWIRFRDRIRALILEKPQPMDVAIEQQLRLVYREDILTLQKCIGRDLTSWLKERKV